MKKNKYIMESSNKMNGYKNIFDKIRAIEGDILEKEAKISKLKVGISMGKENKLTKEESNKFKQEIEKLRGNRKALRAKQIELIKNAVDAKDKIIAYSGADEEAFEDMFEDIYGSDDSFLDTEDMFLDLIEEVDLFEDSIEFNFEGTPKNVNSNKIIKDLLQSEREIVVGLRKIASINNHITNATKEKAKLVKVNPESLKKEVNNLADTIKKLELKRNSIQSNINKKMKNSDISIQKLASLKKVAFDGDSILEEFDDDSMLIDGKIESFYGGDGKGIFGGLFKGKTDEQKKAEWEAREKRKQAKFDLRMESKRDKQDIKTGIKAQAMRDELSQRNLEAANERSLRQRELTEQSKGGGTSLLDVLGGSKTESKQVADGKGDGTDSTKQIVKGVENKYLYIGGGVLLVIILVVVVLMNKK